MRTENRMPALEPLKEFTGQRMQFQGTFDRFGAKTGWKGAPMKIVRLIDITFNNKVVADHLWFNWTKEFSMLTLQPGDRISFNASVVPVSIGCEGYDSDRGMENPLRWSFKLSHLTGVSIETTASG